MNTENRLPFVDAIKVVACQLVVLHHLAFYGPMSDYAKSLSPEFFSWLSQYARIAVQVFLVTGGFLAARSLTRRGQLTDKPLFHLIGRRYVKLVAPFFFALLMVIVASAISRHLMVHDSISAMPKPKQFIAHILLLQSVLGFDGLSAGAWYVAIDFQLYALLLAVLWLARHVFPTLPTAGRWCVFALAAASLLHFNRDAAWSNWALYFIGSYGLGAITFWSTQSPRGKQWLAAIAVLTVGALWLDYRLRILVSLLVAGSLAMAHFGNFMGRWPASKSIDWLGKISYSVFLTHFSTSLIVNGLFDRFAPHTPEVQFAGVVIAWVASILVGAMFYYGVETRAQKWFEHGFARMRHIWQQSNQSGLPVSP